MPVSHVFFLQACCPSEKISRANVFSSEREIFCHFGQKVDLLEKFRIFYVDCKGGNKLISLFYVRSACMIYGLCDIDEVADEGAVEGDDKKKKRQTRGGKGMIKTKKETAEKERKVVMSRAPRGKKKYVTVVTGLGTFGKYDSHLG